MVSEVNLHSYSQARVYLRSVAAAVPSGGRGGGYCSRGRRDLDYIFADTPQPSRSPPLAPMFRKGGIGRGAKSPLRKSDAKKFRARLLAAYPLLSAAQLEAVWPPNEPLAVQRESGMRLALFCTARVPLCYEVDDPAATHGLAPSLYLLHAAPQIMPSVTMHAGLVETLARGADLFVKGLVLCEAPPGQSWVVESFGRFAAGDKRLLVEEGSWIPVAVATWALSHDELEMMGTTGLFSVLPAHHPGGTV